MNFLGGISREIKDEIFQGLDYETGVSESVMNEYLFYSKVFNVYTV